MSWKVVAILGCTPADRGFCIPRWFCGEPVPVSTRHVYTSRSHSRCEVPLGFCLVAFPPPPVTNPSTRPSIFRRERLSTFRMISSDRRRPFLSGRLGLALRPDLSKPFGFGSGRSEQRLSAPSVRGRRVTTPVPPSGAGQSARKQPRLCSHITPVIRRVK